MAKTNIPDCLTKREHLYGDGADKVDLVAIGDAFRGERRWLDAFMYYRRADDTGRISELKERMIETGNFALLAKINLEKDFGLGPDEWKRAAEAAENGKLLRYATDMYALAGLEDKALEIRASYGDVPPEEEKENKDQQ